MRNVLQARTCALIGVLIILVLVALTGCECLKPGDIAVYGEHTSHISQHFGSDPTNYGFNSLNVSATWSKDGAFLEFAEGLNMNKRDRQVGWMEYGALDGPREITTVRVGYDFHPFGE